MIYEQNLNQVNLNSQFTMGKSTTNLSFLDIMINKTGTKIWMNIYSNPTDSKRYYLNVVSPAEFSQRYTILLG